MPIDIISYLNDFEEERYRVFVLHTDPEKSMSLTSFCQKFCEKTKGTYIDLLEFFIQNNELASNIDSFNPENLRKLLLDQSKGKSLLVIDRVDFLLDTWRRSERQDFFRLINDQWDGFKDGMKAKLVFCLQTSQEIDTLKIVDSKKQSRIFRLSDFYDIA
jgi:hypothetical protein